MAKENTQEATPLTEEQLLEKEKSLAAREEAVAKKEAELKTQETGLVTREEAVAKKEAEIASQKADEEEKKQPGREFEFEGESYKFKDSAPKKIRMDGKVFSQAEIIKDKSKLLQLVGGNSGLIQKVI